ncbi:MAG TPA: tetratricopeptide repeat protein [Ktedonobacteraceae bacterium]|nr:tetratricopeptide repeat protein [Ktedonobacteraceae bacterium]
MHFGERLRQERLRRHLTQEELAEVLGTSPKSVGRWEQGRVLPHASARLQMSRILGLPFEELFAEQDEITPLPRLWTVPFPRNPYFTGREEVLLHLHHLLFSSHAPDHTCTLALCGLGGIGKTQVAAEYAYRHAQDYTSIFWLQAETAEHLRSDLLVMADLLDLPEQEEQDQRRIISAVHRWLVSHRHWLLILDNVQAIEEVKELLPVVSSGSLLFTTRLPTLGTLAQTFRLERMTREEGIHFLLQRIGQIQQSPPTRPLENVVTASEYAAAEQLFVLMDGLPLALDQAGAYMEKTQSSLLDFLHLFQKYPIQLLHAREAYDQHPASVATTFLLTFERLQQTNPIAADLLTLYCMLPLDGIPEELVTEANAYLGPTLSILETDTLRYHQALQDLLAYSFVRRLPETQQIVLHRLVQLVIREQLEMETRQRWATCLLQATNAIFPHWGYTIIPDDDMDSWSRNQRFLPLVFVCEAFIEQYQVYIPEALHLLARAAHYLRLRAQYEQAEELCRSAMRLTTIIHQSDHLETAMVLFVHVPLYYDLGRYEEARVFCQRALTLYEQFLGAEHSVTVAAANFLAELSRLCGKDQEAEALFLRVLAFYEHHGKGAEISSPLFSLGNLYRAQRQFEKAESLLLRALALRQQELGPEHFHTAGSLRGLALLYMECERYDEAEALYQRAFTIYEQTLGPEHPQVALALMQLGQLYVMQQRYSEAEGFYQRSLVLQECIYAPEHIHFISLLTQLGQLAIAQKCYHKAEENLKRALSLAERALAPEHGQMTTIRAELFRLKLLQQM